MNVLVACEVSGVVREAFAKRGHNAVSVDLLPSMIPGRHEQKDIIEHLEWYRETDLREMMDAHGWGWDLMIAFPPCTHLAVSGARWFSEKQKEQEEAVEFFRTLLEADIPKICIENPVGIISSRIRKPDQYVQPWMFGDGYTKKTGLWLKGLPPLVPTNIVEDRDPKILMMPDSKDQALKRSITPQGLADAMASQWG